MNKLALGIQLSIENWTLFQIRLFERESLAIYADEKKETFRDWLQKYFQGISSPFPFKISLSNQTDFSLSVLSSLQKIPRGTVISYKDLAKEIGRPKAYRAVGNALNKNPYPLLFPCHRVCNEQGKIGGFASGKGIKKALLELESYTGFAGF